MMQQKFMHWALIVPMEPRLACCLLNAGRDRRLRLASQCEEGKPFVDERFQSPPQPGKRHRRRRR